MPNPYAPKRSRPNRVRTMVAEPAPRRADRRVATFPHSRLRRLGASSVLLKAMKASWHSQTEEEQGAARAEFDALSDDDVCKALAELAADLNAARGNVGN